MHVVNDVKKTSSKGHKPPFHCSKCGACCLTAGETAGFEELVDESGLCKLFDREKHLCTIYAERPLLCNVEATYDVYLSDKMSWEEYLQESYKSCRELRKRHGIPEPKGAGLKPE